VIDATVENPGVTKEDPDVGCARNPVPNARIRIGAEIRRSGKNMWRALKDGFGKKKQRTKH